MASDLIPVSFVITELNIGGAEQCLVELATRIGDEGFAPQVISLWPEPEPDQRRLVDQLRDAGIPVEATDARRWNDVWKLRQRLRRAIQSHQPQIIQSFLFHANIATGFFAPKPILCVGGVRVADPSNRRGRLERWAAKRMARIVSVSEGVRQHIVSQGIGRPEQHVVIANGVSASLDPARPQDAPARYLLFAGRLHPQKGLLETFSQFEKILRHDPEIQLVLLGDGPLREDLLQRKAESSVGHQILLPGWQPDARAWIHHAELLLLPSHWEGMPNVVLEAMAESTAIVATKVQGVAEVLGPTARLQTTEREQFAARTIQLLEDTEARMDIARQNLERVGSSFSWQSMTKHYARLYRKLLDQ